ncbi:MAG: UvrD-helicase domain-containing protein, partial [Actinomycetota bacterium]
MFDALERLNPSQREAVEHLGGPLLVVAGAGSGKTWTLACRVARLVERGVLPERILLLTFTR